MSRRLRGFLAWTLILWGGLSAIFALFVLGVGVYYRMWQAVFVVPWAALSANVLVSGIKLRREGRASEVEPGITSSRSGGDGEPVEVALVTPKEHRVQAWAHGRRLVRARGGGGAVSCRRNRERAGQVPAAVDVEAGPADRLELRPDARVAAIGGLAQQGDPEAPMEGEVPPVPEEPRPPHAHRRPHRRLVRTERDPGCLEAKGRHDLGGHVPIGLGRVAPEPREHRVVVGLMRDVEREEQPGLGRSERGMVGDRLRVREVERE